MYIVRFSKQADKDKKMLKSAGLVYEVFNEYIIQNGEQYEGTVMVARMWTHYDKLRYLGLCIRKKDFQ